jgi:gliding motility-associated-like protein
VKNLGNVPLLAVQVTDSLLGTFPEPVTFNLSGPVETTGSLLANATFDGISNRALLVASGSTLAPKDSATITFTVRVWLNGTQQTVFYNSAIATAQGPAGGKTIDVSMVGTNPDPNENGDPTEKGENEPTPVILDPLVIPQGYSPNADGVHDTFFIRGLTRLTADVLIYNRWGNLVYEQRNYQNNWNGHSNTGLRVNSELPDGTYYYIIRVNDGRKFAGYLTLAR